MGRALPTTVLGAFLQNRPPPRPPVARPAPRPVSRAAARAAAAALRWRLGRERWFLGVGIVPTADGGHELRLRIPFDTTLDLRRVPGEVDGVPVTTVVDEWTPRGDEVE